MTDDHKRGFDIQEPIECQHCKTIFDIGFNYHVEYSSPEDMYIELDTDIIVVPIESARYSL